MEQNQTQFDIRLYLEMLLRHRWLCIAVFIAVSFATVMASYIMPQIYESSATILVEEDQVVNPLMRGLAITSDNNEKLRVFSQRVTTRANIDKVVKKLDMDVKIKSPQEYENLLATIQKKIEVKDLTMGKGGTMLFRIAYTDPDPKKAASVVKVLSDSYIEENLGGKREEAHSAVEFIQGQLETYRLKLEESEKNLKEFKEKHISDAPGAQNANLGRLDTTHTQLIETRLRLKELSLQKERLKEQLAAEKPMIVAFSTPSSVAGSGAGSSLQARLSFLQQQLSSSMLKYTDKYPEVLRLKGEIEDIKGKIAREKVAGGGATSTDAVDNAAGETTTLNPAYQRIKEDISKIEIDIISLKSREIELQKLMGALESRVASLPKEEQELAQLTRGYNVNNEIYQTLLRRLEEAKVSKDLEVTEKGKVFKIVDPPVVPTIPIKPDRVKLILMGLFLGVGAGFGVAFMLDFFDTSLKNRDDVLTYLKLPVLGAIPQIITEADVQERNRMNVVSLSVVGVYVALVGGILLREAFFRFHGTIR